jgi:hypothetical protein
LRKLIISASIGGLVLAGAYWAPTANAACPAKSTATPGATHAVGPATVYTSGDGSPPAGAPATQNGFIGVSGSAGYVEANGGPNASPASGGYVVASNGTSGVVVSNIPPSPAQC